MSKAPKPLTIAEHNRVLLDEVASQRERIAELERERENETWGASLVRQHRRIVALEEALRDIARLAETRQWHGWEQVFDLARGVLDDPDDLDKSIARRADAQLDRAATAIHHLRTFHRCEEHPDDEICRVHAALNGYGRRTGELNG